jgi:hypothetical protein
LIVVAQLSEWLQLMLAEIARKQEEQRNAADEQQARQALPQGEDSKRAQSG